MITTAVKLFIYKKMKILIFCHFNKTINNKITMNFIIIDKETKSKFSVNIDEKNKVIKIENKSSLNKYKLDDVENILLLINSLKETEGLCCTFIESIEKITINVNHKILKTVCTINIPLVIEKEQLDVNQLIKRIKKLERQIETLTKSEKKLEIKQLILPSDLFLTERDRYVAHASKK